MNQPLMDVIRDHGTLVVPGVFDALSARLAEVEGFDAVYLSGSATAATAFGKPDVGLVGMAEMGEQCRRMVQSTSLPIIADGDTGHGNENSVRRTVETFESAGVAAITIEDQSWPKRCGYMDGLEVVGEDEMSIRIRAALRARRSPDFAVVGRTDSLGVEGLDRAIERGKGIQADGADMLWIVGLQQLQDDELRRVRQEFDIPLIVDHTEIPSTLSRTADDYAALGVEIVLMPLSTVLVVMKALQGSLRSLRTSGDWRPYASALADFEEYNTIAGVETEQIFSDSLTKKANS